MGQHLVQVGQFGKKRAAQELLHTVAGITFPHAGNRSIDSDDEGGEARIASPLDGSFRYRTSTDKVELVPDRPCGRGFDILEPMSGNGGQRVPSTRGTRRRRRSYFSARMHEPGITYWGEDGRKGELLA